MLRCMKKRPLCAAPKQTVCSAAKESVMCQKQPLTCRSSPQRYLTSGRVKRYQHAMGILRALLVLFLAAAVATSPLAGSFARANAAIGVSLSAVPAECCGDGDTCGKAMPDCGSMAGCVLKCSVAPGALSTPFAIAPVVHGMPQALPPYQRAFSAAENPPLPPPRL
jgi:hypothetical protein